MGDAGDDDLIFSDWDTDEEEQTGPAVSGSSLRAVENGGNGCLDLDVVKDEEEDEEDDWYAAANTREESSEAGPSCPSMISHFIRMGYREEMVVRAIEENGEEDASAILDTLFRYLESSSIKYKDSPSLLAQQSEFCNEGFSDFGDNRGCQNTEAGPSQPSIILYFMRMGYAEKMVVKAVRENGEENPNDILDTLLTYAAVEEESPIKNCNVEDFSHSDDYRGCQENMSEKNRTILTLVDMGFHVEEASSAVERCGLDASVLELADSIEAARLEVQFDVELCSSSSSNIVGDERYEYKKRGGLEIDRDRKKRTLSKGKKPMIRRDSTIHEEEKRFKMPNPMIGFGLPFEKPRVSDRYLPEAARSPPYFYYENVAYAPVGVWEKISRFLFEIEPEFVDSKFFSAAARKRGYIHNLPITGRFPLLPIPPKTIFETFPNTRTCWPIWDTRTQLNCLQTCITSTTTTNDVRDKLDNASDSPPRDIQNEVLGKCRRYNLIWVGRHRVATLEPDEIELLLGFPRDHTRGIISRTERYKSLGNSFQVDTVAYHLSVLKKIFPNGMTVLSLFSGIGGAEVALDRLGIRLKTVVSVELEENNRRILKSWWQQTHQTGNLIDFADIQELSVETLKELIDEHGPFDLVIGGSPCNNLAGSNRHHRDGLEGEHSSLFFEYVRILDAVKCIMENRI